MHKPFQKLGLFVSKNVSEETNSKSNDKHVKYLYKKESKSEKRKIASAHDPEKNSKKQKQEDRSRSHKRRSSGSLDRHKKKEASETEIFFISPEEIKRHRKKLNQKQDKSPEREKRRHSTHLASEYADTRRIQQQQDDIVKLLKQQANKNSDKDDYQWLTKKEVFKIINNVQQMPKDSSTSSNFLKKFFLFDKEQNNQEFIPVNESKYSRKSYNEDPVFARPKTIDSHKKKHDHSEKTSESHTKKHREHSVDQMHAKDSKRQHEKRHHKEGGDAEYKIQKKKDKGKTVQKEDIQIIHKKEVKQPKHHERNGNEKKDFQGRERMVSEDVQRTELKSKHHGRKTGSEHKDSVFVEKAKNCEGSQVFHKKEKASSNRHLEKTIENEDKNSRSKSKPREETADKVKSTITKKELKEKLQNVSRVNPKRHKFCLVKSTFAIVEIPPKNVQHDKLEEKKQLASFRKYYRYDNGTEVTTSGTFHSDSHKMYQDMAESVEDSPRRHRSTQGSRLKLVTHLSSVVVPPEPEKIVRQASHSSKNSTDGETKKTLQGRTKKIESSKVVQSKDDDRTGRRRSLPCKSKIPVPHSNRIVELARNSSPASKARRRSADLFTLKFSDEVEEHQQNQKPNLQKKRNSVELKEQIWKNVGNSTPNSARSSVNRERSGSAQAPKSTREIRETKVRPSIAPKFERQETKLSRTSTVPKQSKMSAGGFEKKSPKLELNASKNRKITPSVEAPNNRKGVNDKCQKGNKSPSRLSNDGASSIWSKSSRNTHRTSLSSKSDTKLPRSRQVSVERKCKTFERSSAKTSLSNSTCGDKSMDASRNTTSFFLTKSYKDDDKLSRWQRRKLYSDTVRRNAIAKNQKAAMVPPQVMEVRYLTVSNSEHALTTPYANLFKDPDELRIEQPLEGQNVAKEFYKDDLPEPCVQLVDEQRFEDFFATPTFEALNDILKENSEFLQKDFTFKVEDLEPCLSSDDFSGEDLRNGKNDEDWFNFKMRASSSISDISCSRQNSPDTNVQHLTLDSRDRVLDSISAPGSEESGYSTIKSRPDSRSFFDRPAIKALMQTQIETASSSECGLRIRQIESKSLQTAIDCSQKSVQIKFSEDRVVNFSKENEEVREGKNEDREEEGGGNNEGGSEDETRNEDDEVLDADDSDFSIGSAMSASVVGCESSEVPGEIIIFVKENKTDDGTEMYEICEIVQRDRNDESSKKKKSTSRYKKFKRKVSSWSCLSCYTSKE